jgi:hypothetical protein
MAYGRRLAGFIVVTLLLLVALVGGWLAGRTGMGSVVELASLSEAERQFADRMSGSSLVGLFTIDGREARGAGRPERYDLSSVEKVGDDQWRFNARIRYGSVDATVPIVVPLRFLGDTPMITLTDLTIPTLGTFTARVFFHEDRYSGVWQHGAFGGHMYGRIEKNGEAAEK